MAAARGSLRPKFSFTRGRLRVGRIVHIGRQGRARPAHGGSYKLGVAAPISRLFRETTFAAGFSNGSAASVPRGVARMLASPLRTVSVAEIGRVVFSAHGRMTDPRHIFCDFGTVKGSSAHPDQSVLRNGSRFRINVPEMGPAPLAFDFAFPFATSRPLTQADLSSFRSVAGSLSSWPYVRGPVDTHDPRNMTNTCSMR